jgi:N-acetylglucosaminyl-diphospho-decaprenol L-rhamnosyltransferase
VTPDTPVFIAHHNRAASCRRSLAAFHAQDTPVDVTVVDNDSRPAERAQLADGLVAGRLVTLTTNAGFGPALNALLRSWLAAPGAGPAVILAPHDVLPRPNCVRLLLDALAAHPRLGIVSAVTPGPQRAVVSRLRGPHLVAHHAPRGLVLQDFPHGMLFAARRACLESIGVFDERFFAYGCEIELGCRARRAGWQVGAVWDAIAENPETTVPTRLAAYLHARNAIVVTRDDCGWAWGAFRTFVMVANTFRLAVWKPGRPRAFSVSARLRAAVDAWRGRMGPPPADLWPGGRP